MMDDQIGWGLSSLTLAVEAEKARRWAAPKTDWVTWRAANMIDMSCGVCGEDEKVEVRLLLMMESEERGDGKAS